MESGSSIAQARDEYGHSGHEGGGVGVALPEVHLDLVVALIVHQGDGSAGLGRLL